MSETERQKKIPVPPMNQWHLPLIQTLMRIGWFDEEQKPELRPESEEKQAEQVSRQQ